MEPQAKTHKVKVHALRLIDLAGAHEKCTLKTDERRDVALLVLLA